MKLKVLVDNNTYIDEYFVGEPAASYYIECDNKRILFDTGYSDVVIKNAVKMGIDLKLLDYIVISHGHDDHTRGLKFINENYDETMEIVAKELDLDKSAVEEMFKQYDFSLETTDADVKAFQNVADFMLKTGMIENEVNAEDLFIK